MPHPINNLPTTQEERHQLKKNIEQFIQKLHTNIKQNKQDQKLILKNIQQIETLELRLKLIDKCNQFSMLRLNHLEEIFKHYCTHVFRTGKHMTFDRLQYDQVHMTIERFFLFLKDFQLTTMMIHGKPRQIIEKSVIILHFKKMSSNARDLSFEQFMQCIEKLAIIYYDEKSRYFIKQEQLKKQKQKRKLQMQKRRIKRLKLNGVEVKEKSSQSQSDEEDSKQQNEENEENKNQESRENKQNTKTKKEQLPQISNQNDDFINELINDKEIVDPNDEVKKLVQVTKQQNDQISKRKQDQKQRQAILLTLTPSQKIEYYYGIINIDSVADYKNKLTILNLPVFRNYKKQQGNGQKQNQKALSESKIQAITAEEEERLKKIKQKLNQKKQKQKERPLPKPSNEQALREAQNARKRKQLKKQRQQSVKQVKNQIDTKALAKKLEAGKKTPTPVKMEYKQSQISWQMLQKIGLQQMKLKHFNPTKLYTAEQDDRIFLQEYGAKPKVASGIQVRERQSLSIVENAKKRANEVGKTEKMQQKNLNDLTKRMEGNQTQSKKGKL